MKKVLEGKALRRAYPPMRPGFSDDMRRLVDGLPEEEKEIMMKRKVSLGLVFAILLILVTLATALALTLPRAFFEDVGKMQVESGYYDDWTLKEKLDMLALMEEYGVALGADVAKAARDTSVDEAEREAALDAYMAERYGILGRTDVISLESILLVEKGDMVYWSVEDKAWYIAFQRELGLLSKEEERVYTLPKEGDMTQEDAEAFAREVATKRLSWTQEQQDTHTAYFACLSQFPDPEVLWEVCLIDDEGAGAYITFPAAPGASVEEAEILNKNRDMWEEETLPVLEALVEKYGPMQEWGLEAKHEYMPDYHHLPGEGDIAPEEAREIAISAITSEHPHVTRETLEDMSAVYTLYDAMPEGETIRTYTVNFQNKKYEILYYAAINAQTGECWITGDYTQD